MSVTLLMSGIQPVFAIHALRRLPREACAPASLGVHSLPGCSLCVRLPPSLQDPTWQLEHRCCALLEKRGPLPYYQLHSLLGDSLLPAFLLDRSEQPDAEAAFKRFLENRPHLFRVHKFEMIQLATGRHSCPCAHSGSS